ncbi:MAG: PSD1 and planctomycete cytochrome C domain-containing protein [Isosphaeraceae bacterium]
MVGGPGSPDACRSVSTVGSPGPRGWALRRAINIYLLLVATLGPVVTPALADDPETNFEVGVRPVLAGTCFPCHGGKKTSGGLRVDSRDALLRGGDSGPAIVPGDPESSRLLRAVRHDDADLAMPPGRKLADREIEGLSRWIKAGAAWPSRTNPTKGFAASRHWAFEPVKGVNPPDDPTGWAASPIDRFVAAGWRTAGVEPVEQVDPRTLIRRLTFDLTGLPPTPEETAEFLADSSPAAYQKLVDRLLASPRYGERWGRHWLDLARYADTAGDNADYPVPELAKYRDYVIDAFNADKPYDQFIREQLAGDVLASEVPANRYAEQVVATGFLALSRRYATGPYELWHLTLEDAVDATGRALMGLTLRCARCHDHKFDPLTQKDYYALYGAFASTVFPYAGSEEFQSKKLPREHFASLVPPAESGPRLTAFRQWLTSNEEKARSCEADATKADPSTAGRLKDQARRLREAAEAARKWGRPEDLPGAYAVSEGKPADSPIHRKGDPGQPGPVVPRGAPGFLRDHGCPPPSVAPQSSGRRELAEWLTRPEHPLTARVMVNRVWQHHFGRGIVATPSNFGLRGEPPSHPELLDWLADRFVRDGWSIKALHRRIVTSEVYQLSSRVDPEAQRKDPGNRWLCRFDRRRLDAESLRDALLAVSGRLDPGRPGAHPFPPVQDWHWTQHTPFKESYPTRHRTVFLMTQRLQRQPFLALFDGPDTNGSTEIRSRSTVPLQSLYLMNDPFVRDCAGAFADRVRAEPGDAVVMAVRLAWNREPSADERQRFMSYLDSYARRAEGAGAARAEAQNEAWTSLARVILTANEFLYVD